MNTAFFMGRLTGDPDIRYSQDGNPVVRFGFAVNRIFRRDGDPEADFFSCVCFGKTAERFDKLGIRKGTKLLLTSEIRNDEYTDKDGNKRKSTQVIVNNFEFCESKGANGGAEGYSAPTAPKMPEAPKASEFMPVDAVDDDGLPFN